MLSRDGVCAALEHVLTLPVREADFSIEKGDGDSGEAEFARSVIMTSDTEGGMRTPVTELVGQVTTAQIYRRAFFEKTFKVRPDDGKVIYDKIAYRPPATCQARYNDRTGDPNGFRQQVWLFGGNLMLSRHQKVPGYVDIPKVRSYIYTHGKNREPLTGAGEMDVAWWPWAHGTRVPTPDGWTVIEDLRPGDMVFGVNGQPVKVTAVHPQGRRQMYRVTMRDGSSAECGADHLWGVYDSQRGQRYRVVTTREMMEAGLYTGAAKPQRRFSIPRCEPAGYPERALPVDPYILGAWLGDGSMQRTRLGVMRYGPRLAAQAYGGWIAGEVGRRLPPDMKLVRCGNDYLFLPVVTRDTNPFRDALVSMGVNKPSAERFIPAIYMQASVKQRLDLLRGLMDTDGSAERGNKGRYFTKSPQLAQDVRELARSLGGTAIIRRLPHLDMLRVEIQAEECPFLLPEKAERWSRGRRRRATAVVSIEPTTVQDCRCITIDRPDGLFLVNDYITGHNCYKTKLKVMFLWLNFLESQSMPRLVVYGNDQPEATRNADDISQLKASGIVGLPHPIAGQKMFEQITSPDAGAFFQAAMSFLENWQIMSVLAGFLGLTGMATAGRGSYSLSQDQSDFFLKSRQAVAKEIADSISYDVLRPLVMLNFGSRAAFPRAVFGPLQDEQVQLLMTLFGQIVAAPALHIPLQVVDLLTERMASVLQLDVTQVSKALKDTISQRSEQMAANPPPGMPPDVAGSLGGLQGMAQAGAQLVHKATSTPGGVSLPPLPAGPPAPPVTPSPARSGTP